MVVPGSTTWPEQQPQRDRVLEDREAGLGPAHPRLEGAPALGADPVRRAARGLDPPASPAGRPAERVRTRPCSVSRASSL